MPVRKAKRADNRYTVTMTIGFNEDGSRKRKFFYGATQKEAKKKMEVYKERHKEGLKGESQSLHDWIVKWVETSSSKESTRKSNKLYASKLDGFLGDKPIDEVRMIDITRFAQSIAGKSFSTVKKAKWIANRIFQDAIRNRIINYNPCDGARWEYGAKGSHRALEDWEKDLIVGHHLIHRAGLWAILMLLAGLRRGEALALQWEDIDFEENVIHITKALHFESNKAIQSTTKTEAGIRDVPMIPLLRECLERYEDRNGSVCRNSSGKPIESQSAFKRGWESWLNAMENILNGELPFQPGRRSDLKDDPDRKRFNVRTHDLRHTFCTMLYKAGVGLKEAQYIMGHADSAMTLEVYTHLDEESRASAATILAKYRDKM